MNIGIAYADKFKHVWLKLDVPEGSTVRQAIEKSGLLEQFPEIDLEQQKVGIFGKITRVEIYRPIPADPETVERRDNR